MIPMTPEENKVTLLQEAVIETHPAIIELMIISRRTRLIGLFFEEKKKGHNR